MRRVHPEVGWDPEELGEACEEGRCEDTVES